MQHLANTFKRFTNFSFSPKQDGGSDAQATIHNPQTSAMENNLDVETVSLNEEHTTQHGREFTERIEGFADVLVTPNKKNIAFTGLLVPGVDHSNNLRNRFIFLDYRSQDWFKEFCWEIAQNNLQIPVRVYVSSMAGENRAFVKPCARTRRQAEKEWGRLQEEMRGYPIDIKECRNTAQVCEFVYRKVAKEKNLTIVKWIRDDYSALAINKSGLIFRMSGAKDVDTFVDGILSGYTTLDEEIARNVTVYRAYRI